MFSSHSEKGIPIVNIFDIISLFAAKMEEPKIGLWGEGFSLFKFWIAR